MNTSLKNESLQTEITNISRRNLLKGFALTGFVLAVGMPFSGFAEDEEAPKYGRDAMPHGWVDNICCDSRRWQCNDCQSSFRNGAGGAHQPADGRG